MKKTVILTGATGKIGAVLTRHILAAGFRVVATGRSEKTCQALKDDNKEFADNLICIPVDFKAENAIENFLAALDDAAIKPFALINNARCLNTLKTNKDGLVSKENFLTEFYIDVVAPYELSMGLASRGGAFKKIINIGSIYGVVAANPNLYASPEQSPPIHYSVAKAALTHLTKELAVRLAPQDIQVNCVSFGGVQGRADKEFEKRYAAMTPIGRMLNEDELAEPVLHILTTRSLAMTGHVLHIDGGWTLW